MATETTSGTPPSASPSRGPTLEHAAAAFENFLDAETATPVDNAAETAPDPAQAEAFQGSDEELATGDEPPADTGETSDGDETPTEQEEPGEQVQSTTPVYTVRVNGKPHQVTIDEALKGYSRTADYNAKTQSLAESRKAFEQERAQLLAERQQYAALLPALTTQIQGEMGPEPNWDDLYRTNPLDYVRQKDLWRERQDRIAAAQYEQQRLQQVNQSETEATRQELMKKGREYLQQKNPAWTKAETWEADRAKLVSYARKNDYSDQEIGNALDPRSILIMDKARRYDELMANKPKPVMSRGPRPASAGVASNAGDQQTDSLRARNRLAKTGRIEDAAAVFRGLLG